MVRRKDIPKVQNPPAGDGHHITSRYMTTTELAEREARQTAYDDMLARQHAYENKLIKQPQSRMADAKGCVFAKSCQLPNGVINHVSSAGFIPVEKLADFGELCLLGGRECDTAGNIPLRRIGGRDLPAAAGTLLLGTSTTLGLGTSAVSGANTLAAGITTGALLGMVALLWPSNLGDSSLYTEEQLKSLDEGRTRVRLHLEQQADGTLKGYGYNTQTRSDWEMIPVIRFVEQGEQQVADFGNGATLIWTPAAAPSSLPTVPPLETAPKIPQLWIYPPTEQADKIIVNPVYPPEYQDFILVFPAGSGIRPLYIVLALEFDAASYHGKTDTPVKSKGPTNGQEVLENSVQVKSTSPRRVGVDPATNELVVFDRTGGDVYHGHVRPWDKLHQDMKNALIKAKQVDSKGRILGDKK